MCALCGMGLLLPQTLSFWASWQSKDLERDGVIPQGSVSIVSKSTITHRRQPLALLARMQKSLKGFDLSLQSALATPSLGVPSILALQANDVYVFLDDSEKAEVKSLHLLLYNPDLHFRGLRKRDEEHSASNDGTTPVKREGLFGGLFVASRFLCCCFLVYVSVFLDWLFERSEE